MAKKKPRKRTHPDPASAAATSRVQIPGQAKLLLWGIPLLAWLFVWFSTLSFVPVPWPDDSAFYFVAKDLFSWPPRWVMLPQAPFEPSYYEWNFNTMPLYPILIGLGRLVGIDGSWQIKFWPLLAWALSGAWLGWSVFRRGLPLAIATLVSLLFALNPAHRWGSVIVRPESLIGLCGVAIVLGLSLGYPERLRSRGRFWDPTAFLLAIAAYCHFNAIHLLFPVVLALWAKPRQIVRVGLLTSLYLVPWIITVAWHPALFVHQMTTQWRRLAGGNDWLQDLSKIGQRVYSGMGVEDGWPEITYWGGWILWGVVALALGALARSLWIEIQQWKQRQAGDQDSSSSIAAAEGTGPIRLNASAGWVLGAIWLFHNKPEQWFLYYWHASAVTFLGVLATKLWVERASVLKRRAWVALALTLIAIFGLSNTQQWQSMSRQYTWTWDAYYALIDCIDAQLIEAEKRHTGTKPFHVFGPTFPDILVELSKRHPHWGVTRTNDFWEAADRAVQHGREVDALVVTELYSRQSEKLNGPSEQFPRLESVWMQWQPYYLNRLYKEPGWKPRRWICQEGRTQAFLFMN